VKLYTYWRSQASYRVRIALALKGLHAELLSLDLLKGDQFAADYRALNPEMVVPTLIDNEGPPLVQSLAILEYLDERYPDPPLLPNKLEDRARTRAIAYSVAIDAHPFIVPRVRKYLGEHVHLDEQARTKWIVHWLDEGSTAVEALLARDPLTGPFCIGGTPTVADICLAAHFASAQLFGARDAATFPIAGRIFDHCMQHEAFALTHPLRQPGAPSGGAAAV
jgi:maleylacetoacetate isomerase